MIISTEVSLLRKNLRYIIPSIIIAIIAVSITVVWTWRSGVRTLNADAMNKLNIYSSYIAVKQEEYKTDVRLLAESSYNREFMRDRSKVVDINEKLSRFNETIGADVTCLIGKDGIVAASSSYNMKNGMVGKNVAFRDYFKSALKGIPDSNIVISIMSNVPSYFKSYPVFYNGELLGVAAIKFDLDLLKPASDELDGAWLITDRYDVVLAASDHKYEFKSLYGMSEDVLKKVKSGRNYSDHTITPLPIVKEERKGGVNYMTLHNDNGGYADYLFVSSYSSDNDFHIYYLIELSGVRGSIYLNTFLVILSMVLIAVILRSLISINHSRNELKTVFDNLPMGIVFMDKEFKILKINRFLSLLTGADAASLIGRRCYDVAGEYANDPQLVGKEKICSYCNFDKSVQKGSAITFEVPFRGRHVRVVTVPNMNEDGTADNFMEIIQDITFDKVAQENISRYLEIQTIANNILKISLWPLSLEEMLEKILHAIMTVSWISLQSKGCIFLSDNNTNILEIKTHFNFTDNQLTNCKNIEYGRCICGLAALRKEIVFSQDTDDLNHVIRYEDMRPHGHFCTPIIHSDRVLGVINIYIDDTYVRNDADDNFLKGIADTVAGVLIRKEIEDRLLDNYRIQAVINEILSLSIKNISLKEHLEKTLEIISTVPWLSSKETGCIFLMDDNREYLIMKAHRGVSLELFKSCGMLPLGRCLCGLSALTGELVFKSCIDEQHDVTFETMTGHGHYCVPIKSKNEVIGVINLYVKEGHVRNRLEEGFLSSVANTLAGIIELKTTQDKIEYMANYDSLTGLANRVLFYDRLRYMIKNARRFEKIITVMYVDIDNFKNVNDSLSHNIGDQLLVEIALRLRNAVRETDMVSRISGDEFTIILSDIKDTGNIDVIANKILDAISVPVEIDDLCLKITVSIGISLYPKDGDNEADLLKRADIAMYHSKKTGKNMYSYFSIGMDSILSERMHIENELRSAIERNELVLYYQPQIDIKKNEIIGVEVLIRWRHPEMGLVMPDKFIPVAEDTGFIIPIGEWVLKESCKKNTSWKQMGLSAGSIAVNISLKQIARQYNLADHVLQTLYETKMEPHRLELEITESFGVQNLRNATSLMKIFNSMGILLAIDDFGTGYSSLSYLKHLPFNKLKIDKSFVKDLPGNNDDTVIVKTIIDMAHNLKLKVIAEGVETTEQLNVLSELGCDEVQGFLYSRPVPEEELITLLRQDNEWLKDRLFN